jgi:hypothetical protein
MVDRAISHCTIWREHRYPFAFSGNAVKKSLTHSSFYPQLQTSGELLWPENASDSRHTALHVIL